METRRLQINLDDIERRVKVLREQAFSMQSERESILELLQNLQDNTDQTRLQDADREDFDLQLERLVLRCLTVEVSIATPRNEIQEDAFKRVSDMLEKMKTDMTKNPSETEKYIESYLNASLPEPLSGNINQRFQDKLLGCTLDDQKTFRKKLQKMYSDVKSLTQELTQNGEIEDCHKSLKSEVDSDQDTLDMQGPTSPRESNELDETAK